MRDCDVPRAIPSVQWCFCPTTLNPEDLCIFCWPAENAPPLSGLFYLDAGFEVSSLKLWPPKPKNVRPIPGLFDLLEDKHHNWYLTLSPTVMSMHNLRLYWWHHRHQQALLVEPRDSYIFSARYFSKQSMAREKQQETSFSNNTAKKRRKKNFTSCNFKQVFLIFML